MTNLLARWSEAYSHIQSESRFSFAPQHFVMEIAEFLAADSSTMFGAGQTQSITDLSECVFIPNNWLKVRCGQWNENDTARQEHL